MKRLLYPLFACTLAGSSALAQRGQFTFSVDWRSPALAQTATGGGQKINEGDVLTFAPGAPGFAPLPNPSFALTGDQLGLVRYNNCQDHLPFTPCGIEVDALSQGRDKPLVDVGPFAPGPLDPGDLWFSTDEFAVGASSAGPGPNLLTEGGGVGDASADVFVVYGLGAGPIGPLGALASHVGVFDGDGAASASGALYIGIGLHEPNLPGAIPPTGDNLDALDIGALSGFPPTGYYMSLDGPFTDPLTGLPNSATAVAQGVSSADVLHVAGPGLTPVVYASAASLGLDFAGLRTDDIDALALFENGVSGFQPSSVPYDWSTGTTDMLLFSVRRGSAVVGLPDSIFGAPIEPGDILTAPLPTALGGLSPFPGILFSAESLGLATTRTHAVQFGDDLNALDIETAPCFDCNNNGVEDAVDISTGGSSDVNGNGIPDECEKIAEYCQCPSNLAPCSNSNTAAGCANSLTAGAHLRYSSGSIMTSADDLVLLADALPKNKFGLFYMGGGTLNLPIGDGVLCVGSGGVGTFRYGVQNSGAAGLVTLGPGIVALSCASFFPTGCIAAGDTWYFQAWYRDPAGPCSGGFNFSNGIRVEFVP
jgi:hypothetical protein